MITDIFLDEARSVLGVPEDSNGEATKNAYTNCMSCLIREEDLLLNNKYIEQIEKLNRSVQILINHGATHTHRMIRTFSIDIDPERDTIKSSCTYPPQFNFVCWDPFEMSFSSFEHICFIRAYKSEAINFDKIKQYFLPYQCLCKLIYMNNNGFTEEDIPIHFNSSALPRFTKALVQIFAVRTSLMGRSKSIDQLQTGTILNWRIMEESERYPYSIELLSQEGSSLGEIPNNYSACLSPLLKSKKIEIRAIVNEIERKCDRGKGARCSHMKIHLHITRVKEIPYETYFNV